MSKAQDPADEQRTCQVLPVDHSAHVMMTFFIKFLSKSLQDCWHRDIINHTMCTIKRTEEKCVLLKITSKFKMLDSFPLKKLMSLAFRDEASFASRQGWKQAPNGSGHVSDNPLLRKDLCFW